MLPAKSNDTSWFDQCKRWKFYLLPGSEILSENSLASQRNLRFTVFYTRFVEKSKMDCQAHELQVFNLQNSKYISLCLAADFEFTTIHMLPGKSSEIRHTARQLKLTFSKLKISSTNFKVPGRGFCICNDFHTICGEVENHCQAHEIHVFNYKIQRKSTVWQVKCYIGP